MKKILTFSIKLVIFLLLIDAGSVFAQYSQLMGHSRNHLNAAVPLLLVPTDARSLGMGLTGVAGQADVHSNFWNPAKMSFIENLFTGGFSYQLPVKSHQEDNEFLDFEAVYKLNGKFALGISFKKDFWQQFILTNNTGRQTGTLRPTEYAVDASFSGKLSEKLSLGITGRYIYSDVYSGQPFGPHDNSGNSVATDLGLYYTKPGKLSEFYKSNLSLGIAITNIGSKFLTYFNEQGAFLPTLLRLGSSYSIDNQNNKFTVQIELSKLLIPTLPVYEINDSTGLPVTDSNGDWVIEKGKDPDVDVFQGMLQSFYDSPGGSSEELCEIAYGLGFEYAYKNKVYCRVGTYHQNIPRGNDRYLTLGLGLKFKNVGFDVAYLLPIDQPSDRPNSLGFSFVLTI
ncbi:MAG: type IX secretion system outer membrane channel protein PorV [Bacteroidetes bacterium]|nr:type IX secretion system outer membrane channel protein PorV [Bacteroidota bacterium]